MRTLADLDLPPEELLARLDRRVVQMFGRGTTAPAGPRGLSMSCTCAYAVYDPVTRPAPSRRPATRRPRSPSRRGHLRAGADRGRRSAWARGLRVGDRQLPEDSVVALYTDGLVETRTADIDEGLARLQEALAWGAPSLEALCSHVTETMAPGRAHRSRTAGTGSGVGAPQLPRSEDDVALLLARTRLLSQRDAAAQKRA